MKYLLDTCIVSETTKRKPNGRVCEWLASMPFHDLYLSVVTLGEIQNGVSRLDEDSALRRRLVDWLAEVRRKYSGRIIPFDEDAALLWGRTTGECAHAGRTMPTADSQIAATARSRGMTLVTRNVDDMAEMGIPIFNPFAEDEPA